ncbi:MAG: hypothetical protein AAGC44_13545 [Planctomycetota bacterium]
MLNRLAVTVRGLITSFLMLAWATSAWALPQADTAPKSDAWKGIAAGIIFLIAIAVGNFMSPRRSHQD